MESDQLGRLQKVELRNAWTNEAYDFTPWLAMEKNLKLLGSTIGIDLELEGTERNVGPFNADILCKDTVENKWVIIENQLERTDHTHLGQLMTYAAGLNAVTVVWIAGRFTDEHRAVMDWLNEITEEGINFFGLEIELWRIGESPMAPKFNIESKPNDWSKKVTAQAKKDGELSEVKQLYLKYWTAFNEYAQENAEQIQPRTPRAQYWMDFAIGRSNAHLSARISEMKNRMEVNLYLSGEEAEALFHLLKRERPAIENEVGYDLIWDLNPDKKAFLVRSQGEEIDPSDESDWDRQHEFLCDVLDRFYATFSPRVKRLDVSNYQSEEDVEVVRQ